MSDFTDFFPAGGGNGIAGGGIPINGYFPMIVGATGTTGYDQGTGLYTHPDGTFWAITGKSIAYSVPDNTYPNATGATAFPANTQIRSFSPTLSDSPIGGGASLNSAPAGFGIKQDPNNRGLFNNIWAFANGTATVAAYGTDSIFEFVWNNSPTIAGNNWEFTGNTINVVAQVGNAAFTSRGCHDGTNIVACGATNTPTSNVSNLFLYTTAGTYTGTTTNVFADYPVLFGSGAAISGIDSDGTNIYAVFSAGATDVRMATYDKSLNTVRILNLTTTASIPTGTTIQEISVDLSGSAYLTGGSAGTTLYKINLTTGAAESFTQNPTALVSRIIYLPTEGSGGEKWILSNGSGIGTSNWSVATRTVGDATARTDTDSAQPLFVRIK